MNASVIAPRTMYIDQIFSLLDSENLIIVSGVRRSGKSCVAMQLEEELKKRFADEVHVIRLGFEKITHSISSANELIAHLKDQYAFNKKNYILLDEILRVDDWERAVNFLYRLGDCKLILFSSNRRILSPKLQAIQEEKCDMLQIFPLSLKEFIQFQEFQEITKASIPLGKKQYELFDGKTYTIQEIYKHYLAYGGLPVLKLEYVENDRAWVITDGSYGVIITRDILEIDSSGDAAVTDPVLLRCVTSIMAKSLGNNISATWISKQASKYLGKPTATKTVQSYIQALLNAHMFYIAERFDIRSEQVMKTMAKYYIVDTCFHHYLTDVHADNECRLFENKVYFELLRRGYTVYNGRIGSEAITFVAMKDEERIYIQVANDMSEDRLNQLFSPLRKIHDDHTKMIIALGTDSSTAFNITYEGFIIIDAFKFLMGEDFKW